MILKNRVYFVGAGPGDPDLITVKGKELIEHADVILFTGSLIPEELLKWSKPTALIQSSAQFSYIDIFNFIETHIHNNVFVRLHTGDPSVYSTIAKQIDFLKSRNIQFEIIPGVTAAFAAASSAQIEYTIPGVSQTIIITRIPGNTPNPEAIENILNCKHSSIILYLSINLIDKMVLTALSSCSYDPYTPCWVIVKASWPDEIIIKGTLDNISYLVKQHNIKGIALILLGHFLLQEETIESNLYNS